MTHTDPIKTLVDLGPEIKRRVKLIDEGVMVNGRNTEATQSQILHAVLAAIEALTPIAEGTSVGPEPFIEALTPSGETKAAYIGEFKFPHVYRLPSGAEHTYMMDVPWTTIKEIMRAIKTRALAAAPSASTGKDNAPAECWSGCDDPDCPYTHP